MRTSAPLELLPPGFAPDGLPLYDLFFFGLSFLLAFSVGVLLCSLEYVSYQGWTWKVEYHTLVPQQVMESNDSIDELL